MLTDHIETTHLNMRKSVCSICDAKFTCQTGLNYHTQTTHSSERKFLCEHCPKTFLTKVDYKGHQRVHREPEMCNMCGGLFKSLKGHLIQVHGIGKRPPAAQQCPACNKVFKTKKGFNLHIDNFHLKVKAETESTVITAKTESTVIAAKTESSDPKTNTTYLKTESEDMSQENSGSLIDFSTLHFYPIWDKVANIKEEKIVLFASSNEQTKSS